DELPQAQPAVVAGPVQEGSPRTAVCRVTLIVRDQLRTAANSFGLLRHYLHRPSYDPNAVVPIDELCNRRKRFDIPAGDTSVNAKANEHQAPWPFANMSTWRLMTWASSGGQTKSKAETTQLVNDVLLQDDFNPADLNGFNAHTENIQLDRSQISSLTLPKFQESAVTIQVPSGEREIGSQDFCIPGLQYR
ncbi:hypothetical protein F5890DRAFT_1379795, partial [Lentinula detonsa]